MTHTRQLMEAVDVMAQQEERIKDLLLEKDRAEQDAKFWKQHAGQAKEKQNKLSKLVTQQAARIRALKKRLKETADT